MVFGMAELDRQSTLRLRLLCSHAFPRTISLPPSLPLPLSPLDDSPQLLSWFVAALSLDKEMAASEDAALVIVVDASASAWWTGSKEGKADRFDLGDLVDHLHAFVNAVLLSTHRTRIGFIVLTDRGSSHVPILSLGKRCLHSSERDSAGASTASGNGGGILEELKQSLLDLYERDYLRREEKAEGGGAGTQDRPALSSAYSRALCLLRRYLDSSSGDLGAYDDESDLSSQRQRTRILFLHGSRDVPGQYVQVMNASFCAQKMGAVVDTFMLGGKDSSFLQQASSITGGIYTNFFADVPSEKIGKFSLSSYLINIFLADLGTRKHLQLPEGHGTGNLKVTCFLTKKPLDIGFVCSVCLSIFSKTLNVCAVCGTHFQDNRGLKRKVLNRTQ